MAQLIEIQDFMAPELDVYARLTEAQLRNKKEVEKGIFLAESPKVITVALDMGYEPLSMLMEQRHVEGQAKDIIARCGDIPVYYGKGEMLQQLTGFQVTRGILCAMRRPLAADMETVAKNATRLVVLDGIVDSTNIGAIFRAAAALGMDGVLVTPTCCDPFCRRAVRVSMGTVFQIPWAPMMALGQGGAEQLSQMGFQTVAMALSENAISLEDSRLKSAEKLAIVMGTEGDGLPQDTIDSCHYTVKIPMAHGVDSLNVASASAVAFWQLGNR